MYGGSYVLLFILSSPLLKTSADDATNCRVGNGASYAGTQSVDKNGDSCKAWNADWVKTFRYPNKNLGDGAVCRNPGAYSEPWCWLKRGGKGYCGIPVCAGMRFKLVSPKSERMWDVKLITLTDDHGDKLPVTKFFDSNHAKRKRDRYTPVQAFTDNNKWWGGRKDDNGVLEIGGETPYFPENTLTVELLHPGPKHAVTQGVQFMVEKNGIWEEKCIMTMKSEVDEYAMYCKIEEWN